MIDERLMAPGRFSVEVDPSTPEHVLRAADRGFMVVAVLPTWTPVADLDPAGVLDLARYSGIFRRRSVDRRRIEGAGLAVLLGDEDGKGNTHTVASEIAARPFWHPSDPSWLGNNVMRPAAGGANGLTVGSAPSGGTTKAGNIEPGDSQRDVLDFACDLFNYEWRVNHNGTIDAGPRSTVYPRSAAPRALATRDTDGFGLAPATDLLPVTGVSNLESWEDWSSHVFVTGPTVTLFGTEYAFSGSAAVGSNPHTDLAADPLTMRRVIQSNKSKSDADNAAIAARKVARFDRVEQRPEISTDLYDVGAVVRPGDALWVHDLVAGLSDPANQVDAGAGVVHPLAVRCSGLVWPVREGMGVLVGRHVPGAGELPDVWSWTDLTEFVVFERAAARVDVGVPRRLLRTEPKWRAA